MDITTKSALALIVTAHLAAALFWLSVTGGF